MKIIIASIFILKKLCYWTGMKCASWWAKTLSSGKTIYLCCFRDGLGKVVLVHTTHTMFGPGMMLSLFFCPLAFLKCWCLFSKVSIHILAMYQFSYLECE